MTVSFRILPLLAVLPALLAPALAQSTGPPRESITFGRVFMGDLGDGTSSSTEILLTNRDPNQSTCRSLVIFSAGGTAAQQEILFNGQFEPNNTLEVDIPRGGSRKLRLTTDGGLVTGAVLVAPFEPCNQDSIAGTGRFTIQTNAGNINELYSIAPNTEDRWLRNQRCVAIATCFKRSAGSDGFSNNLGVAFTGVIPGFTAPPGSRLEAMTFDTDGNPIQDLGSFAVDGSHQATFPLDRSTGIPDGPLVLILCFFTSDPDFKLDLTTIQVSGDQNGNFQFDSPAFTDGFESGDISAWTVQNP